MKRQMLTFTIFGAIMVSAQVQKEPREGFFDQLNSDSVILTENGLVRSVDEIIDFVSGFAKSNGNVESYQKNFSIKVSSVLAYEIGEIHTISATFSVMFLKRKIDESESEIELLTIYKKVDSIGKLAEIDQSRKEWMELCNAHKAEELVTEKYTSDAYYYNRGRLLQGTKSIIQEYGYMNRASYSLKLTPKHVVFVTPNIVYEIGQCSGSYLNPYMLLWEKQADGNWQVRMDSND